MHAHHLQGSEFFQYRPRAEPRPLLERYLQAVGHKGDEDVRLDAVVDLMGNGPQF